MTAPAYGMPPFGLARGGPRRMQRAWSAWRAAGRLAVLLPVFVCGAVVVALSTVLPLARDRRDRLTRRLTARFAERLLAVFGVRVQRVGRLPKAPALIVCNHLGWLDVLVLLALVPDVAFIAKREVGVWPVVGRVTRAIGSVFVDRKRKRDLLRAIPALERVFAAGRPVVLFAEGTTTDGTVLLPFKSSLFEGAVRAGVPVVPVAFRPDTGRDGPSVRTHVCWWGDMALVPHLPKVAGTRAVRFVVRIGEALPMDGRPRKPLAVAARGVVARQAGVAVG